MFITKVLLNSSKKKSKYLLVTIQSMVSGHRINLVRPREQEKFEFIKFDPWTDSSNSNGFNSLYNWYNIKDAFKDAKIVNKPIFLLIHKPWCPSCKNLKEKISKSVRLIDLSRNFIMVNVENSVDEIDKSKKFYPDGKYVPRILFFAPNGKLIKEAYNRNPQIDPQNRYFYKTPAQIIDTMLFVLSLDFEKRNSKE